MRHLLPAAAWLVKSISFGVTLLVMAWPADPLAGQLLGVPDHAVPTAYDGPTPAFAGSYGRRVSDASAESEAVAAMVGIVGAPLSVLAGFGLVSGRGAADLALGARLATDIAPLGRSGRIGFQAGIGWAKEEQFVGDASFLRFPIGIAMKGRVLYEASSVTPWAMPRLDIVRVSEDGASDTHADFGASGGLMLTTSSGFGVHTAIDVVFRDPDEVWLVGVGAHYLPGS